MRSLDIKGAGVSSTHYASRWPAAVPSSDLLFSSSSDVFASHAKNDQNDATFEHSDSPTVATSSTSAGKSTDCFTPARRSEIMGLIRSEDTQPEIIVRRLLHRLGFRFRLHRKDLPGKPDIVMARHRTVINVHGCFWHGHTCKEGRRPKSNLSYWNRKLDRNQQRDLRVQEELEALGWRTLVVWECETKDLPFLELRLKDAIT
jgi:DNA mismatch endonuclease (patch repair protein)